MIQKNSTAYRVIAPTKFIDVSNIDLYWAFSVFDAVSFVNKFS